MLYWSRIYLISDWMVLLTMLRSIELLKNSPAASDPAIDEIRRRALDRLYRRRDTVCELIRSLEDYQKLKRYRETGAMSLSVARKCS